MNILGIFLLALFLGYILEIMPAARSLFCLLRGGWPKDE
jgi:hypothetical protein